MSDLGKTLILFGALIALVGAVVLAAGRLSWLGRLPGDLTFRRNGLVVYVPLASCLLASGVLSLLFYLFRR
jgi:hypothetical protein